MGAKAYPLLYSSLEAEAAALSWAMKCIDNMGFEEVIFESDSMNLIEAVRDPILWPWLSSYTDDILTSPRRYFKPEFRFYGREVNGCAAFWHLRLLLSQFIKRFWIVILLFGLYQILKKRNLYDVFEYRDNNIRMFEGKKN